MSYFVRHKLGKNTNWDKFAHIFRDLGLSSWKVYFMNIFRQYRTWLANDYSERINRFHWTNRTWADSWETANTSVNNLDDDSDWSWHIWHKPETVWSYWGVSGVAGFDFAWQRLSYLLHCLKSARSYFGRCDEMHTSSRKLRFTSRNAVQETPTLPLNLGNHNLRHAGRWLKGIAQPVQARWSCDAVRSLGLLWRRKITWTQIQGLCIVWNVHYRNA